MLYIIGAEKDLYKIGISDNPERRLKQLQTGNGHKLKLIDKFKIENERVIEKRLHNMLWQYKSVLGKNEWFVLSQDAIDWLKEYLKELQ